MVRVCVCCVRCFETCLLYIVLVVVGRLLCAVWRWLCVVGCCICLVYVVVLCCGVVLWFVACCALSVVCGVIGLFAC